MNIYFVTTEGKEVSSNLSHEDAIKLAKKLLKKNLSVLNIGIGKRKRNNTGKLVYTLLPAHFHF
jgi:hypothetical protein